MFVPGFVVPMPTLPAELILNFSVKVELVAPPVNVPTTNAPAAELVDSLIALKTTLGLEVPEPPNVLAPVPAPLHN